ncbi:hypothetical protein PHK61_06010 [Actinomycetospora lutea]|uniref:hypothetical protein n=1 Tax=Actinomycetospora lutea TaxID=663604 RepID=UPI002365AEDF|nr:hypothetical protein [Actinomycetospora lutea]MDD7937970.1 hypothetical protein [Actinomycetospora lutea]
MSPPVWATALVLGCPPRDAGPEPADVRGNATGLPHHERSRYRAAAHHARRVFPGALGELLARELRACAEFGYGEPGLVARVATQVLTMPVEPVGTGEDGEPAVSAASLPGYSPSHGVHDGARRPR